MPDFRHETISSDEVRGLQQIYERLTRSVQHLVTRTLNLDIHGKTRGSLILEMELTEQSSQDRGRRGPRSSTPATV
jgi:hypothetical protein